MPPVALLVVFLTLLSLVFMGRFVPVMTAPLVGSRAALVTPMVPDRTGFFVTVLVDHHGSSLMRLWRAVTNIATGSFDAHQVGRHRMSPNPSTIMVMGPIPDTVSERPVVITVKKHRFSVIFDHPDPRTDKHHRGRRRRHRRHNNRDRRRRQMHAG